MEIGRLYAATHAQIAPIATIDSAAVNRPRPGRWLMESASAAVFRAPER